LQFASDALWCGRDLVAPSNELVCRELLDFERSEFSQDPGIENVLRALNGCGLFLGRSFRELIPDSVFNLVGACPDDARCDQALSLIFWPRLELARNRRR
jgi:hypothetical protein